jgi:hypothetical protein
MHFYHFTHWPSDPNKIPELLDFYTTSGISQSYMDITPSYDLSSDHAPVIATVSTEVVIKQTIPRLHNSTTNWNDYRTQIDETVNLNISLNNHAEIDSTLSNFISLLNEAALKSTSILKNHTRRINIPIQIKKLLAAKRKARKKWQQSYAPSDKTAFNKATNMLKMEIKKLQRAVIPNLPPKP